MLSLTWRIKTLRKFVFLASNRSFRNPLELFFFFLYCCWCYYYFFLFYFGNYYFLHYLIFCSVFGFSCFLNGICLFEFLGVCVIFVDLTEFLVYSLYGVFWVLTSYNFLKNCWAHCFISYYSAIFFHLGLLLIILLKFWVPYSILDSWVFLGFV